MHPDTTPLRFYALLLFLSILKNGPENAPQFSPVTVRCGGNQNRQSFYSKNVSPFFPLSGQ